eukprot:4391696-Pleurochrysis_carterae.AAC.1
MLVTHISRLNFDLTCHRVADTVTLCLVSAPSLLVETMRSVEKVDEQLNDAAIDFVLDLPSMLGACLDRARSPTHENQTVSCQPPPRPARTSAPIATSSYALI